MAEKTPVNHGDMVHATVAEVDEHDFAHGVEGNREVVVGEYKGEYVGNNVLIVGVDDEAVSADDIRCA